MHPILWSHEAHADKHNAESMSLLGQGVEVNPRSRGRWGSSCGGGFQLEHPTFPWQFLNLNILLPASLDAFCSFLTNHSLSSDRSGASLRGCFFYWSCPCWHWKWPRVSQAWAWDARRRRSQRKLIGGAGTVRAARKRRPPRGVFAIISTGCGVSSILAQLHLHR